MYNGPTANLVSGQLVACCKYSCEIYNGGGEWTHLVDTSSRRIDHSSAVKENRILFIAMHWRMGLKKHRVDPGGRLSFPAGAF